MSKFLLLILAIVAVWWLARGWRSKGAARDAREDVPQDVPQAAPEKMVNCSRCGLYLPQHEAIADGDKYFCSAEHRRQAG